MNMSTLDADTHHSATSFSQPSKKKKRIPEDDDDDEEESLGDHNYHHHESDEDDVDVEVEDACDDDPDDHTGKSVVQEMLYLDCFEPMPILLHIRGGGVPAEEVKNMGIYQQESWMRMDRRERKMASKYGTRRCFYIAFAVEDDSNRVLLLENTIA